jgi:hypothetical protein
MMAREGKTIGHIRDAVENGDLEKVLTPANVNRVLGIYWAGVFLPKHRKGSPAATLNSSSEFPAGQQNTSL